MIVFSLTDILIREMYYLFLIGYFVNREYVKGYVFFSKKWDYTFYLANILN
jgi:hypothetical protein